MVEKERGANAVILYVRHFLDHFTRGEETVYFHADKYVEQHKNNFVLQYLAWRVMTGQNKAVHGLSLFLK